MRTRLVLALIATLSVPAYSQTGTFVGTVARDSNGTAVGQAQVQLPQLNLSVATNYQGEFRISGVPAGRYAVTVRAVGFQPFTDSITMKGGATVDGDIILTALPVNLETVRTNAVNERALSPGLADMESRRKTNTGGYFVTDSALRANNERKLTYFLTNIPGIHQVLSTTQNGLYLANGRESGGGGPAFKGGGGASDGTFPPGQCYITTYIDGAKFFVGPASPGNPPPDFGALYAREYAGIEYYPSGATVPAQYNGTGTSCGILLLWTKH